MIIAIDGPAGSGKSTISQAVARKLGFFYLDTGAMYRALTAEILYQKIPLTDEQGIISCALSCTIEFSKGRDTKQKVSINGRDVTQEIRLPHVTNEVKHIAKIPLVRERMVTLQRQIASQKNVVIEGRDTTTVVFPHAECRIYLDADQRIRAKRRFEELHKQNISVTFEEILHDQQKRDESDFNRTVGPLKKSPGAIILDTTYMTIPEVIKEIGTIARGMRKERALFYVFCRMLCWIFVTICFRMRVDGRSQIPRKGGFILASNHASHLDPILVGTGCPRFLHFFARTTLFKNPLFAKLISSVNAHPIRRESADRDALDAACMLLKYGKGIVLFPEGTRSEDGIIRDGKPGVGYIAAKTGYPVIPTYVHNSHKALQKGSRWISCVPIRVTYGKPLYFLDQEEGEGQKKSSYYKDVTATIMDHIRLLQNKATQK